MGLLKRLVWTGAKIGAIGAVLKLSYDCDVWSLDSKEGARILAALKETVVPGTIVFPKEMLSCGEMCSGFGNKWNSAVDKAFSALRLST